MKKILVLFITCLVTIIAFPQKSTTVPDKKLMNKTEKQARKDAKKMEKEGWYLAPGSIPLTQVLQDALLKQVMVDDSGNVKFIYADGNAVAETKTAAEMQAMEVGKLQLAGMIQTNISSLISANIGNSQLSTQEAASVTEVVQSAKNIIAVELGYVDPTFKLFKNIGRDRVEVQVRLFYEIKQSFDIAKKVLRKELKGKLNLNEQKLEKLIGT
jgi:hypothetical protein